MRKTSKIIKGLLCAALFVGLFSLNVGPIAEPVSTSGGTTQGQSTIADYGGNRAWAQDTAPAAGTGTDNGAEKDTGKPKQVTDVASILETVAKASTYVNNIFNPLIHFLTFGIGAFLGNDYIFAGSMGTMLHNIWVISRNIVNIIFVLILLFLALRYIFKGEESNTTKLLPTFVLLLIAVNFSWLAGKLVLDASNVAANVVFSIPAGIQGVIGEGSTVMNLESEENACKVNNQTDKVTGFCSPSRIWFPADAKMTDNYYNCTSDQVKDFDEAYKAAYPIEGKGDEGTGVTKAATICWQQIKLSDYNQNTASYYLTYSMARVQNLTRANTGDKLSQLAIGTMFSLLIQLVYLTAFASLYIALIIRVAFLWILMAFSPFIVLLMFTKDIGAGGQGVDKYLSISAFINWAFAPAMVGAIWSVGFIMITAGQTMSVDVWKQLNAVGGGVDANIFSASSLFMGMDNIQQFIWLLMTTGIVWMGTFAVLGNLQVVSSITNKIKAVGTSTLTGLGEMAKYAPLPMGGEGKRASLASLSPARFTQGMAEKWRTEQMGATDKLKEAEMKLKASTDVTVNFADNGTMLKGLMQKTGLSEEYIRGHTEEVIAMVKKQSTAVGGSANADKLEKMIRQLGTKPSALDVSVDPNQTQTTPTPPPDKKAQPQVAGGQRAITSPENTPQQADNQ